MITCRELIDFLVDYYAGELPDEQRAEFERHLAVCPPCIAYLNSYQQTVELEKAACRDDEQPAPAHIPEDLVQAILAARARPG